MEQETRKFGIGFGIMCDTIPEQLTKQGYKFKADIAERFETQREAINELRMGGLLIDSICDKITQKLFNKIQAHVVKENKLKVVSKGAKGK